MVTHKEALQAAVDEFYGYGKHIPESLQAGMEAAIRAYLDARGFVMVNADNCVTRESAEEAIDHVDQFNGRGRAETAKFTILSAAFPDPFQEPVE